MASSTLVKRRRSIDLKLVHIQGWRDIRWHYIRTWRLPQKTEIMTFGKVVTVLCGVEVRGGTATAITPISKENT